MNRTVIYVVVALASAAVGYALYQFVVAPRLEPGGAAQEEPSAWRTRGRLWR